MEESIKNRVILILIVINAIFFILAIGSCNDSRIQRKSKERERASRLDVEEKMTKSTQEKTNLEESFKKCQQVLDEEKVQLETTKKALLQEQLVNKSLKEELEKITKLKEALEEDLKEALVDNAAKGKK